MRNILTKLKQNKFWNSVSILTSGTAIAQSIGVFSTPIISRLYTPTEYGQYALLVSISTIIIGIVSLGLNSAIMIPREEEKTHDIFMISFSISIILSTLIYIVALFLAPTIGFIQFEINIYIAMTLIYLFIVLNNSKGIIAIFANKKGMNRLLFNNSLIGAFSSVIISIPLGFLGFTNYGLILASLMGTLVSIVQMIFYIKPFKSIPKFGKIKTLLYEFRKFILYQYPSNFIETLSAQLPTQVLSNNFGNDNLGSYSVNEKLLGLPLRVIGAPINTIYFRTATEYYNENKNIADFTYSLISKIMIISLLPVTLIALWGEEIFRFFLGNNWTTAGTLAKYLIVYYSFMFASSVTSYLRVAIGKQVINFYLSLFRLIIVVSTLYFCFKLAYDLEQTIMLMSFAMSLFYIVDMIINLYLIGNHWIKYIFFTTIYMFFVVFLWLI